MTMYNLILHLTVCSVPIVIPLTHGKQYVLPSQSNIVSAKQCPT